jgi:hypothetical protein
MAKRYRNTERRKEAWYRRLPARVKLAWDIIQDDCDGVGIWPIDMELVSFQVGEDVTLEEILAVKELGSRVIADGRKLFCAHFVAEQFGDEEGLLTPGNKWHQNIAKKLLANGLPEPRWKPIPPKGDGSSSDAPSIPHQRGIEGDKEKEKEREKNLSFEEGVGETFAAPPKTSQPHSIDHDKGLQGDSPELTKLLEAGEWTPEAETAIRSAAPLALRSWLMLHPDPDWIRREVISCLAHYATKPDPLNRSPAGKIGPWLKRGWEIRNRSPPGTAASPAQKPDYSKLT